MAPAFDLAYDPPWLTARFAAPQLMLSWSLNRPGFQSAQTVAWLEISDGDLGPEVDPHDYLAARLEGAGLTRAVGLLTSRDLGKFKRTTSERAGVRADCLITLGLSNAERVGTRRTGTPRPKAGGTINLLCHVSEPLGEPALLEALSVATQARTTAVLEHGYRPTLERSIVTGTGTDCIVLACPVGTPQSRFAGLHTPVGEAVGAAVLRATDQAMSQWLREQLLTLGL